MTRPNILWICTDQQRFDTIAALGQSHIHTPNLDRLCREGTAFTRAYCQNPICTPSRSSFLSGRYPSAIRSCLNGNATFPDDVPLVTGLLADAGYTCGLSGKLHLASPWRGPEQRVHDGYSWYAYSHAPGSRLDQGNKYLEWLQEQGIKPEDVFVKTAQGPRDAHGPYRGDVRPKLHQTTWCCDEAIAFIDAQPTDRPWLMSVNPFAPHPPFDPPDEYARRYDPAQLPGPHFEASDLEVQQRLRDVDFQGHASVSDPVESRRIQGRYFAMIEQIDENVGRLLDHLDARGLRENTLVIFMSDHGEMMGDHGLMMKGCRFYEGLVRVPLIVSGPGVQAGQRSDALVELLDLVPTLLDYAGTSHPEPDKLPGRSLRGLLSGEQPAAALREAVRCEFFYTLRDVGNRPPEVPGSYGSMIRTDRFKLCVYHGLDYGELYDLQADPWEHTNLWEDPALAAVRFELVQKAFASLARSTELGSERIGRY